MKQQKPILHGRDHALGGPDPIPGMNGGGGGLGVDWEDVGTVGGITLALKNPRALIVAQSITNIPSATSTTFLFQTGDLFTNDKDGIWRNDIPEAGAFTGEAFDVKAPGTSPRIYLIKPGLYLMQITALCSFPGTPVTGMQFIEVTGQFGTGGDTTMPPFDFWGNMHVDIQKQVTSPGSTGSSKTEKVSGVIRVPGDYPGQVAVMFRQHTGAVLNCTMRIALVWLAQYELA